MDAIGLIASLGGGPATADDDGPVTTRPPVPVDDAEHREDLKPPPVETLTTVPEPVAPADERQRAGRVELSDMDRGVIAEYAKEYGIDEATATEQLLALEELTTAADKVRRSDPSYVEFRIDRRDGELVGQLAVADESKISAGAYADTGFEIVSGQVPRSEAMAFSEEATKKIRGAGHDEIVATTHDAFTGDLTFWSMSSPDEISLRGSDVRSTIRAADVDFGVEYRDIEIRSAAGEAELSWGGQDLLIPTSYFIFSWNESACTSGFGAYSSSWGGTYADLTAGHCYESNNYASNWRAWSWGGGTNAVTGYRSLLWGGYQDRIFMEHPQVSYWTYTGPVYGWHDMDSVPGHIYQGAYYCRYSRNDNDHRCGTIQSVNHAVFDPPTGKTVFVTKAANGVKCTPGDSGGPVYQPRLYAPYFVSGTVESSFVEDFATGKGICGFLALDDQFFASGFQLL